MRLKAGDFVTYHHVDGPKAASVVRDRKGNRYDLDVDGMARHDTQMVPLGAGPGHFCPPGWPLAEMGEANTPEMVAVPVGAVPQTPIYDDEPFEPSADRALWLTTAIMGGAALLGSALGQVLVEMFSR
jgi:hypothetical protein